MFRPGAAILTVGLIALAATGDTQLQANPAEKSLGGLSGGRFSTATAAAMSSSATSGPAAGKASERQREGTRISDEIGTFQFVGDRVAFLPAGNKDSYRVLENLALERISNALGESRGQRSWVVSGTLTEFRGANYLLVTKAIIQLHDKDAGGR